MFVRVAAAVALVISSTASAVQPAQHSARQPMGKWVAEYADDMCLLQREYGSEAATLTLAFKPEPMTNHLTTYVFEFGPKRKVGYVTAEVRLGPGALPTDRRAASYYAPGLKSRVTELSLSREELERAAASGLISIHAKDKVQATFQVPGLSNALAVLDDCVADLLVTWGFTRDQQAAMAKIPEPAKPLIEYVSAMDYPTSALRNGEQGSNSARYRIDMAGRVSDCRIVESSGSRALDVALCRAVGRFRYRPAIDRAGQAMESLGFIRFTWLIG